MKTLLNITLGFCFFFLVSCLNKKETIPNDRYQWEAGFSAPKYYPVSGAKVDLEYAGCSNSMNFDNGWGDTHGAFVTGETYKKLPKTVTVDYASAVENLVYKGTVKLPYDKIEKLFNKHITNKETERAKIIVGLAPKGWIRVWVYFSIKDTITENIEILTAQVKGYEDPTMAESFTGKKSDYWAKYKHYWNHFGIPEEVWAKPEKEYNLFFNFYKSNPDYEVSNYIYSSLDGTLSGGGDTTGFLKGKLPADLVISWSNKNDTIGYDSHILLPKNFSKIVESKKMDNIEILLEIEKDGIHGILFLINNNKKEKILRFKNNLKTRRGLGYSDFTKEITYYMQ